MKTLYVLQNTKNGFYKLAVVSSRGYREIKSPWSVEKFVRRVCLHAGVELQYYTIEGLLSVICKHFPFRPSVVYFDNDLHFVSLFE